LSHIWQQTFINHAYNARFNRPTCSHSHPIHSPCLRNPRQRTFPTANTTALTSSLTIPPATQAQSPIPLPLQLHQRTSKRKLLKSLSRKFVPSPRNLSSRSRRKNRSVPRPARWSWMTSWSGGYDADGQIEQGDDVERGGWR
jgi:hypothetical protein